MAETRNVSENLRSAKFTFVATETEGFQFGKRYEVEFTDDELPEPLKKEASATLDTSLPNERIITHLVDFGDKASFSITQLDENKFPEISAKIALTEPELQTIRTILK